MKEEILKQLELGLEKVINDKNDLLVDFLLNKLMEAIPGKIDDIMLEPVRPKLKEESKKFLLGQVEKISPLV